MVLKIEDSSASIEQQVQMIQWMEGKVPVPKVLAYEVKNEKSYLLMSKMGGAISCDSYYLEHPQILLEALASGLKMLWCIDVKECPRCGCSAKRSTCASGVRSTQRKSASCCLVNGIVK